MHHKDVFDVNGEYAMQENKKDAYLYLLYRALVEIRGYSSIFGRLDSSDPDMIYSYIKRVNRLADSFHNLPLFLQSHSSTGQKFDEENFLWYLSKSQPEYRKLLDDILKDEH